MGHVEVSIRGRLNLDNEMRFILQGRNKLLFSQIFYVFDEVYVKSNRISCEFSGMNITATL